MNLYIKNEGAAQLVKKLVDLTRENLTEAVTKALRERLERVRNDQGASLADRLLRIGKDCAAHLKEPLRSADHGDLLHDETCAAMTVLAPRSHIGADYGNPSD